MQEFETGAVRDTGGKGRMDLLPWRALIRVSKHMEDALTHYPERNWEKGLPIHSMVDSAFRHLAKYTDGWTDEDHLCAAATNLLMAMWMEEKMPNMQDIPSRMHELEIVCDYDNGNARKILGCKFYEGNFERCMEPSNKLDVCKCGGNIFECDLQVSKNEQQRQKA